MAEPHDAPDIAGDSHSTSEQAGSVHKLGDRLRMWRDKEARAPPPLPSSPLNHSRTTSHHSAISHSSTFNLDAAAPVTVDPEPLEVTEALTPRRVRPSAPEPAKVKAIMSSWRQRELELQRIQEEQKTFTQRVSKKKRSKHGRNVSFQSEASSTQFETSSTPSTESLEYDAQKQYRNEHRASTLPMFRAPTSEQLVDDEELTPRMVRNSTESSVDLNSQQSTDSLEELPRQIDVPILQRHRTDIGAVVEETREDAASAGVKNSASGSTVVAESETPVEDTQSEAGDTEAGSMGSQEFRQRKNSIAAHFQSTLEEKKDPTVAIETLTARRKLPPPIPSHLLPSPSASLSSSNMATDSSPTAGSSSSGHPDERSPPSSPDATAAAAAAAAAAAGGRFSLLGKRGSATGNDVRTRYAAQTMGRSVGRALQRNSELFAAAIQAGLAKERKNSITGVEDHGNLSDGAASSPVAANPFGTAAHGRASTLLTGRTDLFAMRRSLVGQGVSQAVLATTPSPPESPDSRAALRSSTFCVAGDAETIDPEEAKVKEAQHAVKRTKVTEEITSSEKVYCQNLQTLVSKFVHPLKGSVGQKLGVSQEQVTNMFGNVEILANFHSVMLAEFEKIDASIAAVILRYADFLKMYTQYLNNYNAALQTINALRSNQSFQNFIGNCRKECGGLDMMSFLIMPVQRIPRYELLLRELMRYTAIVDPQYQQLQEAYDKIKSIAMHINEQKRHVENMSKLIEVQNRISGEFDTLLQPSRRLIREGLLVKVSSNILKSLNPRQIFLFSDIILWTTQSGKYKGHVSLQGAKVQDYDTGPSSKSLTAFQLITRDRPDAPIVFLCKDENEKDAWIRDVQVAVHSEQETMNALRQQRIKARAQRLHARGGTAKKGDLPTAADMQSGPAHHQSSSSRGAMQELADLMKHKKFMLGRGAPTESTASLVADDEGSV